MPAADALAAAVAAALDADVIALVSLRGGDVADSYRVALADGRVVFAKTHRNPPPGFFTTEAAGLRWLRAATAIPVPEVLAVDDGDGRDVPVLALEWLAARTRRPDAYAFG